jgi:hypothetical protein
MRILMSPLTRLALPLVVLLAACTDTTAPANLTPDGATAFGYVNRVQISWIARSPAASYNIYRSTTAGFAPSAGTKLATVPNHYPNDSMISYVDSGLVNGTPYYYLITAFSSQGVSAPSIELSATPGPRLAITLGDPPAGAVGVEYGPSVLRNVVCSTPPYNSARCSLCPFSFYCGNYPGCGKAFYNGPCITSIIVIGYLFQATGGKRPYSWSSPDLPAGLSLGARDGMLSGIPSAAGSFTVTVVVKDAGAPVDSVVTRYTIEITP